MSGSSDVTNSKHGPHDPENGPAYREAMDRTGSPRRVVVVGAGMVAHRFVESLTSRDDGDTVITVLGEEPRAPYDRVALTSYFSARDAEELTLGDPALWDDELVTLHRDCAVTALQATSPEIRIPHVGWNDVRFEEDFGSFKAGDAPDFYFDHSFAYRDPRLGRAIGSGGGTIAANGRQGDGSGRLEPVVRAQQLDRDAIATISMSAIEAFINRPLVVSPLGVKLCRPSEAVLDLLSSPQRGAFAKEDGERVVDEHGNRIV